MSNTYKETVYRYRVMKQLNDKERNPEGNWSLIYSTQDMDDAVAALKEQVEMWSRLGDGFKIVDAGESMVIERPMW